MSFQTPSSSDVAYAGVVNADGPTLYWRLGEASGTLAADASVNGNAGSYSTGVTRDVARGDRGRQQPRRNAERTSTGLVASGNTFRNRRDSRPSLVQDHHGERRQPWRLA
jgi:hypothetical protein